MYQPGHFVQEDPGLLHVLMQAYPLATLVTVQADGVPTADAVPLDHDAAAGVLRGHVARANPLWHEADGRPVLAVFNGPQGYVSPNWYAAKAETHKVVPTWNYAVVHAQGRLRAVDGDAEWLLALLRRLTARHESTQLVPWSVDDAPADYLQAMLRAVVGIEIVELDLVGKWKLGQNRSRSDRDGVAAALRRQGDDTARALAALVDDPLRFPGKEPR